MKKKYLILIGLLLASFTMVKAQDILDGVDYDFTNYAETNDCKFRMWVPPTCQYVRGVLVAFTQMQEVVSLDPEIRKACLVEDLAIVWANNISDFAKLDAGLNALATASGMPEIATAPFALVGHSTAGIWCRTIADEKPERCFGIIQLNAVDYRDNENVKDIPWITIKNGAEETDDTWLEARHFLVNDKEAYEVYEGRQTDDKAWTSPRGNGCRISLISLINGGHFGWSPFEAKLVSAFIQKAAHYQIGENDQTITRIPENEGWLTDTATVATPQYAAAAYDDYEGDKTKAFWHIDEEFANMWVAMHQEEAGKQAQQMSLTTFDTSVWQISNKKFNLNNGGITSAYPCDAASSVAANPIKVKIYYGIYKVVNGNELYYSPARYNFIETRDWLTFYQEGTDTERYAEITTGRVTVENMPAAETLSLTAIPDQTIATVASAAIPYNVSGSTNIDDWVVSGPVSKVGDNWQINNYTSVPKSQVYIRHAAGSNTSLKETNFTITNARPAQTLTFDSGLPAKINTGSVEPVTLSATATGANSVISYYLLSGPAELNGATLTPTGDAGIITILAIAKNDANNPAKATLTISVEDLTGIGSVESNQVYVFPNPVEDMLNITAPAGSTIQLKDLAGRTVLTQVTANGTTSVSVESLPQGIYLLTLDNGKTVKVIKK